MTEYQSTPEPGEITSDFMSNLGDSWDENDPFAKKTAAFCEDLLMSYYHKVDRALQEILDPDPLNKASALARVSSSGYIPVLAIPFQASVTIKNKNDSIVVAYSAGQKFVSEIDVIYTLIESVSVLPGETITTNVIQHVLTSYNHASDGSNFQEFPVGDHTVCQFDVRVSSDLWINNNKIIEIGPTTESFYTRFNKDGILSSMFGNDIRGKIPFSGSTISINVYSTDGESGNLLSGAELEEYNPVTPQNCEVKIGTVTTNGVNQESWQDMLKSIPFWEQNKGGLGWRNGYIKTIKDGFPNLRWLKFWNKAEHEVYTSPDVDHTNRLYVSAYSLIGQATLGANIINYLNEKHKPDVARFTWIEPSRQTGVITITGYVDKVINVENAETEILKALRKQYDVDYEPDGEEKPQNKISVIESEISDILHEIVVDGYEVFEDHIGDPSRVYRPRFDIVIGGVVEPSTLSQLITVPIENITINLSRL